MDEPISLELAATRPEWVPCRESAERTREVAREVRELVAQQLEVELHRVAPTASLIDDLGTDALGIVDLAFELEQRFDIRIALHEVLSLRTVQSAVECVVQAIVRRETARRPGRVPSDRPVRRPQLGGEPR
jgi:acyl carrier protein